MATDLNSIVTNISLPQEHQFVIFDVSNVAQQNPVEHIPLTFWIEYNGENVTEKNPEPLTLLINPNEVSFSSNKKIMPTFTRGGFVVEEWGEEREVLNFSGTIGAYYVIDPTKGFTGLNRYNRSRSDSFRNLQGLFLLYRNNGAIHRVKTTTKKISDKLIRNNNFIKEKNIKVFPETRTRIKNLGDVFIYYDSTIYKGSFNEFNITEDAGKPYSLSYTFTFTVEKKTVAKSSIVSGVSTIYDAEPVEITDTNGNRTKIE